MRGCGKISSDTYTRSGDTCNLRITYNAGKEKTFQLTDVQGKRSGNNYTTGGRSGDVTSFEVYVDGHKINYLNADSSTTAWFDSVNYSNGGYWNFTKLAAFTVSAPTVSGTIYWKTCTNNYIPRDVTWHFTIPIYYHTTFNGNGGTASFPEKDVDLEGSFTAPTWSRSSATKTLNIDANGGSSTITSRTASASYTGKGWYTASSGGEYICGNGGSYTPTDNLALYQQWKLGNYSNVTLPTASQCTKENYTLLGFSKSQTATTATYNPGANFSMQNEDDGLILYAVWKRNQSVTKIKTSANTWSDGLVWVKDSNGTWQRVLHTYIKTADGWKESNIS